MPIEQIMREFCGFLIGGGVLLATKKSIETCLSIYLESVIHSMK